METPIAKDSIEVSIRKDKFPVLLVILTNLIPLFGVLFLKWSALSIITLYWLESIVVGIFNVLKIAINQTAGDPGLEINGKSASQMSRLGLKLFLVPFFIVHYGMFIGIQGVFMGVYPLIFEWLKAFPTALTWGLVFILLNQTVEFLYGYLYKGRYKTSSLGALLFGPYPRVFIQQFVAIIGSFFVQVFNAHLGALIVFIFFKTLADLGGLYLSELKKSESK